jgi:hypothetical protein
MDEQAARRVILAHAIESGDAQGKLLPAFEREQIDGQSRRSAGVGADEGRPMAPEQFLDLRAQRVIGAVAARNPALAALQSEPHWQRWLAVGVPLGALVLGVATEVVGNPHRVDLVSLPLLGIVAWNVAIYLLLLIGLVVPGPRRPHWLAGLGRWSDGERALSRRAGNLGTQVAALFHLTWYRATAALHAQRIKRVLHLAAACWAVGVALSLLVRGLVVEYRVGWESTFLDASQVHAILSVLRWPAALVFPLPPFSVQEVAQLQFSRGGGAIAGAHWVYMYVALLAVLVVAPRLVLAALALAREHLLARDVRVDLDVDYYRRITSLLQSTRVQLCLVAPREEDRAVLLRVLVQEPEAGRTLVRTEAGDVLRLLDLSHAQVPVGPAVPSPASWGDRILAALRVGAPRPAAAQDEPDLLAARQESDVVVIAARNGDDLQAAQPLARWLGCPVLVVAMTTDRGGKPAAPDLPREPIAGLGVPAKSLPFTAFALSWFQERALLDAIASLLPQGKRAGFELLAAAWEERNNLRLRRSMVVVAEHLLFAARQSEQVRTGALTVRNVLPSERQAQAQARREAMESVVQRLDESTADMFARLRKLHGIADAAAMDLQHRLEQKFLVQQPVDSSQAGVAGAATGAAMGASVDLLVGGLTLGAATALGALVGGSAAFIAAAWKNRAAAGDATLVQLSDEMMLAMVEAGLLRYLVVAHHDRNGVDTAQLGVRWRGEVVQAVQQRAAVLTPYWTTARTQPDGGRIAMGLGRELEGIARSVLASLWVPRQVPDKAA